MENVPRSTVRPNQPAAARGPDLHGAAKRRRTSSFFASVKYVGPENGFFWAVWSYASLAKGACLDAGFSTDVPSALQAIAAVPDVGRSRVALMDPRLAYATFAFIWLASPVIDLGTRAPEDQAYEIARSHQWDPPVEDARPPPPGERRSQSRARSAGRREPGSARAVATPDWVSVLGTPYPCSLDEIRTAFRAGALKVHPDHGGTTEAFVRLKAAYDRALREVGDERSPHGPTRDKVDEY